MSETLIKQHLIDPEICIRCNTCEATCPIGAITHDDRNYVVNAAICNGCMACVPPCPTGSIDHWHSVPTNKVYSIAEQFSWDELPDELPQDTLAAASNAIASAGSIALDTPALQRVNYSATVPPWSAAHAFTNLYGAKSPQKSIRATVAGNVRVTEVGREYDTHHIVFDFGQSPFPVLEGQSIGIAPPGLDRSGKPYHPRQYSIASPRNGERAGYNNASLTVKRVLQDYDGNAIQGVASNYLCDLKVGDTVEVIGPFGTSFLMPNHPRSHIVMICTGTGSAPMRAMTEWRRRLRASGKFVGGKLLLFFGARTPQELPYFGPLQNLPKDFIDINFAFSREPNQPKRYVQDAMRERATELATLLVDPNAYFYVCGLKAMESGVIDTLRDIAEQAGVEWSSLSESLRSDARLHLETY